ncbi:MAG: hypothetical protein Q4G70_09785 [Pseudomonadota bacterium]|nr:hypothetical protein [Pseudomonadota bacterium]
MKINTPPQRFGLSALCGFLLAALPAMAQAQWLTYDEDVYKVLDHLDQQLSMTRKGSNGKSTASPSINNSGDGITLKFEPGANQSKASNKLAAKAKDLVKDLGEDAAKKLLGNTSIGSALLANSGIGNALGVGGTSGSGSFATVRTNTQELLNFSGGKDAHDSNVGIVNNIATVTKTTNLLNDLGLGVSAYSDAANRYYGPSRDSSPNCNSSGASTKYGKLMYENCVKARNVLAAQLEQIHAISKVLDERNDTLQKMLENSKVSATHELQLRHYKLTALQTLIANDQMRLQAAITGYQALRQLYDEKRAEAQQAMTTGKSGDIVSSLMSSTVAALGAAGGLDAGKSIADSMQKQFGAVHLFGKPRPESSTARNNNQAFGQY